MSTDHHSIRNDHIRIDIASGSPYLVLDIFHANPTTGGRYRFNRNDFIDLCYALELVGAFSNEWVVELLNSEDREAARKRRDRLDWGYMLANVEEEPTS